MIRVTLPLIVGVSARRPAPFAGLDGRRARGAPRRRRARNRSSGINTATDYARRFSARPRPFTLAEAAWTTPPTQLVDTEGLIDVPRMRAYRQERLRAQLDACGLAAAVLLEPLSLRYAAGVRNCALFQMHIHAGYLFLPVEGPVVYFDSEPGRNTGAQLETIDEVRDDLLPLSYMFAGDRQEEWANRWAAQIADLVRAHCGRERRIAVERLGAHAHRALEAHGLAVAEAAPALARARRLKCPEEILCMNQAIAVAEDGITRMRDRLRPGVAETELWSFMWQALIAGGGEWIDYRLLASGERTNPWQQEASSRRVRAGDLLVFDCGLVGPWSYGADVSRAFHCGPGRPTDEQRRLYAQALAEVRHNTALLRPGASFRELVDARYRQPAGLGDQPYPCMMHGIGMADEYPVIYYPVDERFHYDGVLEAGMVICVESYVGEVGGREGVKLEDQVLVAEDGPIVLSRYPFEDSLLSREI